MYNNACFTPYYPSSYLEHHGIKGQKWGRRRFQNQDGSLTNQGRQRYGVIERAKIRMKGNFANTVQVMNNTRRAKGLGNKISALAGYDRMRTNNRVRATTQKHLADASRTRLGKAIHNQRSANAEHMVKYAEAMRRKSTGEKIVENTIFAKNALKMPYTRLSGRTTTVGKQVVDNLLTGGTYGLIQDVEYMHNKKQSAK